MNTGLGWIDGSIVVIYVFLMLGIAQRFMGKQKDTREFFIASGSAPWWAAGMSILATLFSSVSITGGPAEFFEYGFQGFGIWWLASLMCTPVIIYVFIRIFMRLGILSIYEYLGHRFSLPIYLVSSLLFLFGRGLYVGVVLYSSAIVLGAAFGNTFSLSTLIIFTGIFSALFSLMGGARAIIWTDVVQMIIIYVGLSWMFIAIFQKMDGGWSEIWAIAQANGKDFTYLSEPGYFSFSLFTRTAFWPLLLGFFFNALAQKGADQLTVQRYLSSPSPKAAAKAMWVGVLGSIPIGAIMTLVGISLYAFYKKFPERIDLTSTGVNGVFPHYMVSELPIGLTGLLIAVVVAAITSTVNAGLQCLATVTLTDFQMRFFSKKLSDKRQVLWSRIWTIIWGALTIGLGIFISKSATENISRASVAVFGLFAGPSLGIFLLGMLTKRTNSWGVGIGAFLGVVTTIWSNYFWKSASGEPICFAWPIVFGVVVTCLFGYGLSYLFPPPNLKQTTNLTVFSKPAFSERGAGNP